MARKAPAAARNFRIAVRVNREELEIIQEASGISRRTAADFLRARGIEHGLELIEKSAARQKLAVG